VRICPEPVDLLGLATETVSAKSVLCQHLSNRESEGASRNVCGRLSGRGLAISAVFRLDTSIGGGRTHGLIAFVHAAGGIKAYLIAIVCNKVDFRLDVAS
jgi:hypothetical protein